MAKTVLARRAKHKSKKRPPLTPARVIDVAMALADAEGVAALSMRRVATGLGVEAMSLYHHFPSKDAILDGVVDRVFEQIVLPKRNGDWRVQLRARCVSARAALLKHRWAIGLLDSRRSPGTATLGHHDAVLGCLRHGGFSVRAAATAFSLVDSYVYGFVLQEVSLPFQAPGEALEVATEMMQHFPDGAFPYVVEIATQHAMKPGYLYGDEFLIGLDIVLDGLARLRGRY